MSQAEKIAVFILLLQNGYTAKAAAAAVRDE